MSFELCWNYLVGRWESWGSGSVPYISEWPHSLVMLLNLHHLRNSSLAIFRSLEVSVSPPTPTPICCVWQQRRKPGQQQEPLPPSFTNELTTPMTPFWKLSNRLLSSEDPPPPRWVYGLEENENTRSSCPASRKSDTYLLSCCRRGTAALTWKQPGTNSS